MKRISVFALFCIVLLSGCGLATPYPTATPTLFPTITVVPSAILSPFPTATITATHYPAKVFELGNGITLIESIAWKDSGDSGTLYYDLIDSYQNAMGKYQKVRLDFDEPFNVAVTEIDGESFRLEVINSGVVIFTTNIKNTAGVPGLIGAWRFDNHWAIEIITTHPTSVKSDGTHMGALADIIVDGQSLKEAKGFQEVFGFQTIRDRPFYFFNRNDSYGVSYAGVDISLGKFGYDEIVYRSYWGGYDREPMPYENAVSFWAKKDGNSYWVLIGVLSK